MPEPNQNQSREPNRLIKEKSPYLLQHAYNPVDWYPWGEVAFEKAKAEDKPVFVSIGYSTCHWCHVMEKESFEDEQVSELMNQAFVCIKVDREERPDIDATYMAACQAMGRSCGWPLNVIMSPDKKPFFVASYIPKDNNYGAVGMLSLVPQIEQIWKTRRVELEVMGQEINEQISLQPSATLESQLSRTELDEALDQLFLAFDHENGGFGSAPKFPSPHNLLFLMRYYVRTKQNSAWSMVDKTLRAMRLGGIFDQVGLGFHRYSTDARWLVPHFEKMLYDQAMLALAYTEAYQSSGAPRFKVTAKETLNYVLRDLTSPEGGFYSAEDADSEGEEGKFYVWTQDEIRQALPVDLADFAIEIFGVKQLGNYSEPFKRGNDKNILHLAVPLDQMATQFGLTVDQVIGKLGKTVNLLFAERAKRVRPARDDKVLVDWNGLTIAALARASVVFREQKYLLTAEKAADFLLSTLQTADGKLYHRYAKGERAITGFLDDYACLIFGLIELYQADFNDKYLQSSIDLTKTIIADFWDETHGGFYFTPKTNEQAIPRLKQTYDGAAPSGNSVALLALLRLARLSGEVAFEQYANRLLRTFGEEVKGYPMGHTFMLAGLDFALGSQSVVLVGEISEKDTQAMLSALREKYLPNLTVTLWTPQKAKSTALGQNYERMEGKATAYVCKNLTCMPPTNEISKMVEYLDVAKTSDK
ncbi:MAG: thioredoxin domain-containing protein [Candidatus Bathyarchaeota archaeon]|nr:thioredoxin domain-containing protein [Candidatus Bathyarchaeota archaeon]